MADNKRGCHDLTTLSLCPLGRPASAPAPEGRFGIDESSCECCREKKSSSPSYGEDEEFICPRGISDLVRRVVTEDIEGVGNGSCPTCKGPAGRGAPQELS